MVMEEEMSHVLRFSKIGNCYYLRVPALFVRRQDFKTGDLFEIEADTLSPTFNIKLIGNSDGN